MANEPKCHCCTDPATKVAVNELRSQKCSIRDIASRVGRSRASVARHLKHSKTPDEGAPPSRRRGLSQAGQPRHTGRCQSCGTLLDDPDPDALVKRAERLLWRAEMTADRAERDDDPRLMLQAVDRGRLSLDQLLKVVGKLNGDGVVVNVMVDNRRKLEAWFADLGEAQVRRLTDILAQGVDICALVAGGKSTLDDVTDNRALTPG